MPILFAPSVNSETLCRPMNESDKNLFLEEAREGDINQIDDEGNTLLMSACQEGDASAVQFLIDLGADPNASSTGGTGLHIAAFGNSVDIIRRLLDAGADPNQADVDGDTPLMICRSLEVVNLLLIHGAEVGSPTEPSLDEYGHDTVWHRHQDPDMLARLLQERDLTQHERAIVFCHAIAEGNVSLAEFWLQRGADVNHCDEDGLSPLMLAADRGNLLVISFLLSRGADVAAVDEFQRTALFYAAVPEVGSGYYEATRELATDAFWSSAIEESPISSMIKDHGVVERVLEDLTGSSREQIAQADYAASIRALVTGGADIEAKDEDGWTPLLVACHCGDVSRVEVLMELGADTGARTPEGWSACELAEAHEDSKKGQAILGLLKANNGTG